MSGDDWPGSPVVFAALDDSIFIERVRRRAGAGWGEPVRPPRDDTFPHWRRRDLVAIHPGLRYQLFAVDGGTTETVLDHQLPQLDTPRARRVIAVVRRRVGQTLRRLRPLMPPDDPIIVGTVYDPSDGTGDAARVGLPPWPEVVELLAGLNTELTSVAAEHGAHVADIHRRFLDHGLRRGNPAQTHPRPADRDHWYCNRIEPNAWGADGLRATFWQALHS